MRELRVLLSILLCALLAACAATRTREAAAVDAAGQLVLVTSPGWDAPAGTLRTFEREGDRWREVGSARPVTLGRAGSAWGIGLHSPQADGPQKREGDGRGPAGVFEIGIAFGYPEQVDTGLAYQAMSDTDWCVDVVGSPYYNRLVDSAKVGAEAVKGASEPMRRDHFFDNDQRYRIGFVIEHNAQGRDRGGSCIFAHVWKSPADATAGCTAMADADMQALLRWLDRRRNPRYVMLPQAEYARLRAQWKLP